jgi:hypothetical protein
MNAPSTGLLVTPAARLALGPSSRDGRVFYCTSCLAPTRTLESQHLQRQHTLARATLPSFTGSFTENTYITANDSCPERRARSK